MRSASLVLLLVLPVAACSEPDTRLEAAQVNWMEWPAEVSAAAPFTVRLVGSSHLYCVQVVKFVTAPRVDQSAVTFEPYFLFTGQPCIPIVATVGDPASIVPIPPQVFDTVTGVPGLAAQYSRTYEIRAGTSVLAHGVVATFPIRTFGDVTVSTAQVENGRINAGGLATGVRDTLGCISLFPSGLRSGYVVENPPADTAVYWNAFVRGYIYEPAAPVCGESKVFHLVTRN